MWIFVIAAYRLLAANDAKLCDNPGNIIQNKTILGVLLAFLLRIVYLLVNIFYVLHFSRVVQFQYKFSTTAFLSPKISPYSLPIPKWYKVNEKLISKLNLDCHMLIEIVVCDLKKGLHLEAIFCASFEYAQLWRNRGSG